MANENYRKALNLLKIWCDAMVKHQLITPEIKTSDGGLFCPACSYIHGRIADAVYPLIYMYKASGDKKYAECAKKIINWSEENILVTGGMYVNDRNKSWWLSTTAFCQASIGKTLLHLSNYIDIDFRETLLTIFKRQTTEIITYFSNPAFKPSINYPIQYCYCMALAYELLKDERYKEYAYKKFDELKKTCFTEDCLIFGEGMTLDKTENGSYCIDLGYNLEESLCALAGFVEIFNDTDNIGFVEKAMQIHLEYMLPDGAIDNSWGSRSFKWTYYGSRTSDGCQGGLLALARLTGNKLYEKAAMKSLELYERCTTQSGLLAGGLMYEDANEQPCIHHTFCHAKAVTELCEHLEKMDISTENVLLPRETEYGTKYFNGANTALVSFGKWRSTISVNDYRQYKYANGGGSITLLWHTDIGAVLAANMSKYISIEPKNMQFQLHTAAELCMTPRITYFNENKHSIITGDGIYSSDNAVNTKISISKNALNEPVISIDGILTEVSGKIIENGSYSLTYIFGQSEMTVIAISELGGIYSLPIIAASDDKITYSEKSITVERSGKSIEIVSDSKMWLGHKNIGTVDKYLFDRLYKGNDESLRAFSTVGGFMYAPIEVKIEKGTPLNITISIK